MTVEELYQYTKERNCEDSQLYVVYRNNDNYEIEWSECVEDFHLSIYDGEAIIDM